jgi:hypothetical protein
MNNGTIDGQAHKGPDIHASLWQFGLALIFLWLVGRYVPGGMVFALLILAGVFLASPGAVNGLSDLLRFLYYGA